MSENKDVQPEAVEVDEESLEGVSGGINGAMTTQNGEGHGYGGLSE
jgi:hypothetical protein